jgi:hypothetical protein
MHFLKIKFIFFYIQSNCKNFFFKVAKFILSLNDVLVNDISTKGTALHYACMKSNI